VIRLFNGDCLELMKDLADNSIDLIITSPPYNIGKMRSNNTHYGTYSGNDMKESEYQQWQLSVLKECFRVLKNTGSLFYNHKVRINKGKAIHPLEWLLKSQFILKQEIVWDMGKSANCDKIRFFPFSERVYWLTKSPKIKLYNQNNLSDVWRIVPTHKRKNTKHIAVMDIKVVENILSAFPSDIVVLDCFMGSGTTGIACLNTNRQFIGMELDQQYFEIAKKRIEEHQMRLFT